MTANQTPSRMHSIALTVASRAASIFDRLGYPIEPDTSMITISAASGAAAPEPPLASTVTIAFTSVPLAGRYSFCETPRLNVVMVFSLPIWNDVDDHDGDVVVTARFERVFREPVRKVEWGPVVAPSGQRAELLGRRRVIPKTVRAQDQAAPYFRLPGHDLGRSRWGVATDPTRDRVCTRIMQSLLGGHRAGRNLFLGPRIVDGQHVRRLIVDPVSATVAHGADRDRPAGADG